MKGKTFFSGGRIKVWKGTALVCYQSFATHQKLISFGLILGIRGFSLVKEMDIFASKTKKMLIVLYIMWLVVLGEIDFLKPIRYF